MVVFQGLLFLLMGVGLLLFDLRSLASGWLPCGPNGWQGTLRFHRQRQPEAYWLMFMAYALGGLALVLFARGLLAGLAEPLPLR